MRRAAPALLAALVLAGCGSEAEGLLPADRAERLSATLREAARATAENDCPEARTFTERAASRIAKLPASVDDGLVDRLEEGVARLRELVPEECRPARDPAETTPTETTAPVAPPTSVPPATTAPPATPAPSDTAPSDPPGADPVPTTPVPEEPEDDGGTGGTAGEGTIAP